MERRRTWGTLAAALALAAAVPAGARVAVENGRQVVTLWHYAGGELRQPFEDIVRGFNEKQDKYLIRPTFVPWNSSQKLLASVVAGAPPDVTMIDRPMFAKFILRDTMAPITDLCQRDGVTGEQFFRAPWREVHYGDEIYGMPMWGGIRCLIINRALFREAGLDPDRPPQSWDELSDLARKLTKRAPDGRITQMGFRLEALHDLIMWGWQNGGDLAARDAEGNWKITLNSPPYVEALGRIVDLIDFYGVDNYNQFLTAGGSAVSAQDPFYRGKVAMGMCTEYYIVQQRRYAPDLDTGLAIFPMPRAGEKPTAWLSGFCLAMPRGVRNREGAWEFMKYMTGKDAMVRAGATLGAIPDNRLAAHDPEVYGKYDRKVLVDIIDDCKTYPQIPVIQELYNEITFATEKAIHHKGTPQELLDAAAAKMQRALDDYAIRRTLPLVNWARVAVPAAVAGLVALGAFVAHILRATRGRPFERRRIASGYLFAAPWFVGAALFMVGPIFVSLGYSFCDYQITTPARWIGTTNYRDMLLRDPLFWKSLWNTVYYTVFAIPLGLAAALGLALLLNQRLRGMNVFRTVFYLPTLVTGVAVSALWLWLLNPEHGPVNRILEMVNLLPGVSGFRAPLWLNDEQWSKPALILMGLWGVGGSMIIFLAGLQGIPGQLYEAAEIDGAGEWRKFTSVTIPMLTPTIFFLVVMGVIGSFQVFTQAYVVSGGMGGPLDSTLFYVLYLYRRGFEDFYMGYASAMAWVLFAVVLVLTVIQLRLSKKWVNY
jgi:multiple sugar transport system permease protein